MFIHTFIHTLALGMPCALSDSAGVVVVSLDDGLEENAWGWVTTVQVASSAWPPGSGAGGVDVAEV